MGSSINYHWAPFTTPTTLFLLLDAKETSTTHWSPEINPHRQRRSQARNYFPWSLISMAPGA